MSSTTSSNKAIKDYTKQYNDTILTSSKDILCVLLLQQYLFPKSKVVFQKETWKFSQLDGEESLIYNINSVSEIQTSLEDKYKKLKKFGLKPAPIIVTTGNGELFLKNNFSIHFDKVIYNFNNFMTCLDCLFKIYIILHLEYPKQSYNFWIFLQKFIYEIDVKNEKKSSIVEKLICDLSK